MLSASLNKTFPSFLLNWNGSIAKKRGLLWSACRFVFQMIEEFTDVNEGEKELMKLWNLHIMKKK